jgi:hypothetical protein
VVPSKELELRIRRETGEGEDVLAFVILADFLTVDLSQANVLTMYPLPSMNLKLRP